MSDTNINANLTQYERPEHIFPTLNATQIARISASGKKRAVQAGEVLVEPGDNNLPFFLVTLGAMEIMRPTCEGEDPVVVFQAGHFPAKSAYCRAGGAWCAHGCVRPARSSRWTVRVCRN
jgi:hypothetical protein